MTEPNRARTTGPALEKWYQFLRWLTPTVGNFPKAQKFILGDRIQNGALDVLERLIEATYSRERPGPCWRRRIWAWRGCASCSVSPPS